MKILTFFILILLSNSVMACHYNMGRSHTFIEDINCDVDFSAWLGYRYTVSTAGYVVRPWSPEMGFNLNYTPKHWLSFNLAMNYVDTNKIEDSLTYVFVSFKHMFDENWGLRLDLGKLRNQFGLYNQTLVNPLLRPGTIAPKAIYYEPIRSIYTGTYGAKIMASYNDFDLGFSYGAPNLIRKKEMTDYLTSGLAPVMFESKMGGYKNVFFSWHPHDSYWTIKGNYLEARLGKPTTNLLSNIAELNILVLGTEYHGKRWTFSVESQYATLAKNNFFATGESNISFSLFASYDVTDWWSVRTNYSQSLVGSKVARPNPLTVPNQRATRNSVRGHDFSIGQSFYYDNWVLGMDAHIAKGAVWMNFKDQKNPNFNHDLYAYGAIQLFYYWD